MPGQFIFELCSAPAPTCDSGGGRAGAGGASGVTSPCDQSTGDQRGRHTLVTTIGCEDHQRAPGIFTGSMQMSHPSNTVR